MSTNGLPAFDTTLQHTHVWINDLANAIGRPDRPHAWYVLATVLHALRDRLPTDEVAHLGAQMPMLLRGMFYEGWRPNGARPAHGTFLTDLDALFRDEWHDDASFYARAVFSVLSRRVTSGELRDVRHALPEDVRALWDAPLVS